jgi:hypothetical protein
MLTMWVRPPQAMIKFNEAQSIRKTYEQIIRRLREERVGFDQQLVSIERTLEAKGRDYEELVLLSGDASHAKDSAIAELEKVRAFLAAAECVGGSRFVYFQPARGSVGPATLLSSCNLMDTQ